MKKYIMAGTMLVVLLLGMSTAVAFDSPTLVTYTITNTTIEPPQTTSIDVAFSEYVSATITIENASGNLVKELYSSPDVKNPNAKIWNGTYTNDTAVPDGTYTVNVTGVNTTTGLSVINTSETITVVTTSGDTTAPAVTANTPTGTDVPISTVITATFSEAMNQTSAKDAFSTSPVVNGSLGWDNDTMTFTPDADLVYDTTYNITIGTGAEDLAGNALAVDYVWDFTTESSETTIDTVTRALQATAAPDDNITVSLTINFDDVAAVNNLAITETMPDGWVVVDASDGGDFTTTGKVTWVKVKAFGNLPPDEAVFTYNVTVPTGADGTYSFSGVYGTNVAGTNIAVLGDVNITVVTSGNTTAPTVTANTPNGTDVAVSTVITATFSEAMNQTSAEDAFSISPAVNGSLGWDNDTMTFTLESDLAYVTKYDVTIGTGAEDLAGNALAADYVWNFTTVSEADPAPTVTANTPNGTDVAVSTVITATFSEAMNQTSAEDAFSISPAVNGSLGWDNDTMTFTPDADLAYVTKYDVTIGTGAEDLAGNALAADYVWNFTTVSEADPAPTVTANTPNGTDVAVSTVITATFSEAMNQTSAEDAFSISPAVNGSLGWDNDTMTFTPDADLAYVTKYDVTIGTGAEDLAGNALAADYVWNFTTVSEADPAPTVTANTPNGTDVAVSTVITATFSEAMNQTSAEDAFSISPAVNGSLGWDNDTMTFTPDADLAYVTKYDVTIGTGAEDLAGNALAADYVWNFTTVSEADPAPTVTANTPNGTDVAVSTVITATFSEAMNQTSAEDAFSISPAVNGSLGWDNDTMTFTPDADLAYSTTYDVTIGTGAEDLAGNSLEESFVRNFTTESDMSDVPTILSTTLSPNVVLSDGSDNTTLTVQASSSIDITSVTVNLSAIGGSDEQALDGTQMEGTGTWTATFNTTTEGTVDLTVTVTDNDGNSATADVTLTAGPYKYTLSLKQGWNMVSLPYDVAAVGIDTTQKLGDLITDAGVSCYYVAWFNPTSQMMESDLISPPEGMPQDTTYPIVGGQAYFVFVENDTDVAVVGTLW